jgi:predicted nucleic acid-binding protein
MRGELALVDTNILLTATDRFRPEHAEARKLFLQAISAGVHLCVSGQIIREYLVVATRPVEVNGLGLAVADAIHNIETFKRHLLFLEETEPVTSRLLTLVSTYNLAGKRIHDANIVALMDEQNIKLLVTQNPEDFSLFTELKTVSPGLFLTRLLE